MLRRLTAYLPLVLWVAILVAGCSQGEKQVMLRYKQEAGMVLNYEQEFKRSVKVIEADSIIKEHSSEYYATISQEITELFDDGSAALTEKDIWFYDAPSKEDSTVMEKREFSRELRLKVRPDGKVLDIEFPDEESKSTIAYIKNIYEQGMPVFPSGEISPGYHWTQTTKVLLPDGVMEASTTYRFKSLAREGGYDCAVIECSGNLVIPIQADPSDSLDRTGVDHIQTTGKVYFAYKEGLVVLQRERWVVDGDRTKIIEGKEVDYSVAIEVDTEFKLVQRTLAP
ncbi:MAG: hypothetical protein KOO62_00300 [candidate division Zixibacteria bacterium]|nr:hypothetical protein [candidate division Zixibacteria bacterium]